jgi:hypothetical protein
MLKLMASDGGEQPRMRVGTGEELIELDDGTSARRGRRCSREEGVHAGSCPLCGMAGNWVGLQRS